VRGCVLKRSPTAHLLEAIRTVAAGAVYVDPALSASAGATPPLRVLDDGAVGVGPEVRLSAREAEVLRLIAQGFCNREIAERLGLSTKTIETYKARSLEKLGLSRRAEIVRFALERGWLGRSVLGAAASET